MKKAKSKSAVQGMSDVPVESGEQLVEALLARDMRNTAPATPVHGVVVGVVLQCLSAQQINITIPGQGIDEIVATPVCAIDQLQKGVAVAVMFAQGDISRPLIIGQMAQDVAPKVDSTEAVIDHERIVIEAEQEIELRCGAAAIIMTRDGRILLRGTYISSHASATQRIRGGAVSIN